jgi:BirA family transcriptional regulator, biotin operon repressor / biotin---[acetyl-CoA-carboxylase] ligase
MDDLFTFLEFPTLASTNTHAKHLLKAGQLTKLTCISTPNQTAGRGTQGRHWVSPVGAGWTFSVVFPAMAHNPMVTTVVAKVLAETLQQLYGVPATVKPINDVMLHGAKLAGILTESLPVQGQAPVGENPSQGYWVSLIIGIGLNVASAHRPIEASKPHQPAVAPIALQDAMAPEAFKAVSLPRFLDVFIPALALAVQA